MPKYVEIDELSEERKQEAYLEYLFINDTTWGTDYPFEMFISEARENGWQFSKD